MILSTLALALCAPACQTIDSADLVQVLLDWRTPLAGTDGVVRYFPMAAPIADTDGGWVASATVFPIGGTTTVSVIVGQDGGALNGPVVLVRTPSTIAGVEQRNLTSPVRSNGRIAYFGTTNTLTLGVGTSAWVDDDLLAQAGTHVDGSAGALGPLGFTWIAMMDIDLGENGRALVTALASDLNSGQTVTILWEWPSRTLLLAEGMALPNSNRIVSVVGRPDLSPNGEHWVAQAGMGSGNNAILADSAILTFADGSRAIEGQPVPDAIDGPGGNLVWDLLYDPKVNDDGIVAFLGRMTDGTMQHEVVVRGGRLFELDTPVDRIAAIDETGALLLRDQISNTRSRYLLEGHEIVGTHPGVDVDGDGIADPGQTIRMLAGGPYFQRLVGDRSLIFRGGLRDNGSPFSSAIVRGRHYRIGSVFCDGMPNSTGRAARIAAAGTAAVSGNEVALELHGLPTGSTGYALVSRASGMTPMPGGSQGTLCLSGSIGRLIDQVFGAGLSGRASVSLDLTAIPQPTTNVAAMAGETWFAQAWYRDSQGGVATSNFTSASEIRFR